VLHSGASVQLRQSLQTIFAVQGLSKRRMDLTCLGNDSNVVPVAGQCNQGDNIVIWDSHCPLISGPVARLIYHMAAVTALKVPTPPFKLFLDYALWCVDKEAHLFLLYQNAQQTSCADWCMQSRLDASCLCPAVLQQTHFWFPEVCQRGPLSTMSCCTSIEVQL